MKTIYIAGPDVFKEEAIEIGRLYSKLCKLYGYKGLYPLDNVVDFNQPKQKIAQDIFYKNKKLIESADIVIANLNPFRGKEADSGTVWECGYASGLGKKVYGYMDNTNEYIDQFDQDEKELRDGRVVDINGLDIENFE
jgi:nucleoside 2-deoxyribosyltransferase